MDNMKRPSPNNKSCSEMLEENCKGCDNAIPIDGDYCGILRGFEKGCIYERKKIMNIVDSAGDNAQAMYLLGQYIIAEELKEEKQMDNTRKAIDWFKNLGQEVNDFMNINNTEREELNKENIKSSMQYKELKEQNK